jgi:Flp pilus assembly protein TadB
MCQSVDDRYKTKCGRRQSHESSILPKKSECRISRLDPGWQALTHYNIEISMRSRFQITLSNRQVPGTPIQRAGFWSRIKRFWAGVALATVAVGVLIAALILGSVIAFVLAILLVIGVAIVAIKVALVRSKRTNG